MVGGSLYGIMHFDIPRNSQGGLHIDLIDHVKSPQFVMTKFTSLHAKQ